MAQVVIGGHRQTGVFQRRDAVNDGRALHADIGGDGLLLVRRAVFLRQGALLRVPADVEGECAGNGLPGFAFGGIFRRHRQFRIVQAVCGQLFIGSVVSHIIGEPHGGQFGEVFLHPVRIQGNRFAAALRKVHILGAITPCGAVLLIENFIVFRPGEREAGHLVHRGDHIVQNAVGQGDLIAAQRVLCRQIDGPAAKGDVALAVHGAGAAQGDLISFVLRFDGDGAFRIVQAVLAAVLRVLDDEGGGEGGEGREQALHDLRVHREGRIVVIGPAAGFVPGESQGSPPIRPGKGLHAVGIDRQHLLAADGDLFLFFLPVQGGERRDAGRRQHRQQDQKPFRPRHAASASFSKQYRCPCPGTAGGTPRSSAPGASRPRRR